MAPARTCRFQLPTDLVEKTRNIPFENVAIRAIILESDLNL